MGEVDRIKDFWDAQAATYGMDSRATAPDFYYRDLEINRIMEHLPDRGRVLDVGCGNGYSTFAFASCNPDTQFLGVDYSEAMIQQAMSYKRGNLSFAVHDIRQPLAHTDYYDAVVSERCLINLSSWEEQKAAILRMRDCLAPNGKLILVENTIDGLIRLNKLRLQFGLPAITVRWHNKYLPENDLLNFLCEHFIPVDRENIGGMYYLISRVIYAAMAKEEGVEPEYGHVLNRLAAKLPPIHCDLSPNWLIVVRKKP